MSQTLSPSLARCYGMARIARVWKISRASVYRSLKETPPNTIARRPGPVGACSDAELAEHIRQHICHDDFSSCDLCSGSHSIPNPCTPG
jgi:putative transposase